MTKRTPYLLAAMASAIAPDLSVVAVHSAPQVAEIGVRKAIETSVVLDAQGSEYDIAVAESKPAGRVLRKRALAAKLLEGSAAAQGLRIRLDASIATGSVDSHPVTISRHLEGSPQEFSSLSLEQCASLGTSLAAVHLLDTDFLIDAGYPRFDANDIRNDLAAWVTGLQKSGEVPAAIVGRWEQLVSIPALWEFTPRVSHGGYAPNDVLFRDSSVQAIRYWEQIQVSDPARDFAWAYDESISDEQRDAVLSAYGRMMGSHMDSRIVPRARLWRQMDIVRNLFEALHAADRSWISVARERVEKLANVLSPVIAVTGSSSMNAASESVKEESATITVGNLLSDSADKSTDNSTDNSFDEPVDDSFDEPVGEDYNKRGDDDTNVTLTPPAPRESTAPSETEAPVSTSATTIIFKSPATAGEQSEE